MALTIERRDGGPERAALAALAFSRRAVSAAESRWQDEFFPGRPARVLGRICVEYFRLYEKPLGGAVGRKVDAWAEGQDKDLAAAVYRLAEEVVAHGPPADEDAALHLAAEFFERGRLEALAAGITQDLARGAAAAAAERVARSRPVDFSPAAGIDVLADDAPWKAVFSARRQSLIELPPGLSEFYGNDFHEGAFVAWMAKFKGGKSFAVQDVAYRMVTQGIPTAYFECGDSTEPDVLGRWGARILGRPFVIDRPAKSVRRPVRVIPPVSDPAATAEVENEYETVEGDVTFEDVRDKLDERLAAAGPGAWRLSCHAAGTLSVAAARQALEEWERRGGVKIRAVLFDYADLLKAPPGVKERRDCHDENWRQLRTLSQEMNIFVGTATQANRAASDAWVLTREHVAEDIRKLAHVTAFYGINQTGDEARAKVRRLNCIINRHRQFDPSRCCYTAGNLSYGDPFAAAAFPDYGGDDSDPD